MRNLTYLRFGFLYKTSELTFSQGASNANTLLLFAVTWPRIDRVPLRILGSPVLVSTVATPDHTTEIKVDHLGITWGGTEGVWGLKAAEKSESTGVSEGEGGQDVGRGREPARRGGKRYTRFVETGRREKRFCLGMQKGGEQDRAPGQERTEKPKRNHEMVNAGIIDGHRWPFPSDSWVRSNEKSHFWWERTKIL